MIAQNWPIHELTLQHFLGVHKLGGPITMQSFSSPESRTPTRNNNSTEFFILPTRQFPGDLPVVTEAD